MSMIGNLFRVTAKDLKAIQDDPSLLEGMIYSEDGVNKNDLLDIDKTWEAILYLLTGYSVADIESAQPPLSWAFFSGQIFSDEQDLGYGPAHYITPEQVVELNAALDKISNDTLKQKFDGKKMNDVGVYPEVWEESEALDYILENFELVKEFYKTAQKENKAVITFIN